MDDIKERVQEIFRDILDDQGLIISDNLTAADIEEWDSINHISIVVSIEQEFGIRFALEEMRELQSVGKILEMVYKKCN